MQGCWLLITLTQSLCLGLSFCCCCLFVWPECKWYRKARSTRMIGPQNCPNQCHLGTCDNARFLEPQKGQLLARHGLHSFPVTDTHLSIVETALISHLLVTCFPFHLTSSLTHQPNDLSSNPCLKAVTSTLSEVVKQHSHISTMTHFTTATLTVHNTRRPHHSTQEP